MSQITVSGNIVDQDNQPISYATIAFQSQTISSRLEGVFSDNEGHFEILLPPDQYLITFQMVGYKRLEFERLITADLNLGKLVLKENVKELEEVIVRTERSYIENDLGKKTLYVGSDLANAGSTAVDVLESLPSVTTTVTGNINVRGSENVIIYVNGRETKRDPKSLQFISADALQKIELITNPSAKYDAEGVAGIINLVYAKSKSTKLEVFTSLSSPFRGSVGLNTSISSDEFTFNVNASERRSLFENSEDQVRLTPGDSLRKYENLTFSEGQGLTREISVGLSYEPDTSFSIGLEVNYLRWDDEADQTQNGLFGYANSTMQIIELTNEWLEIEDEVSLTLSSEKKLKRNESVKLQFTAGGENETNNTSFNNENVNVSLTPIQQSVQSSDETEDQRYYQAKLDYSKPLFKNLILEVGAVSDAFDLNVNQTLSFFESDQVDNRFKIEMDKYAGYAVLENKRNQLEYALGIRYEQFRSTSLQKSTDSTFTQRFNNLFPSLQWKYAIGERDYSLGFNFTRRINRPSFWEVSPFLSYTDPLNLETGNPFLRPEFGYLYELTYSGSWEKLSFDLTGFRRTTEDVIQRVTSPLNEEQLLVSYANLGTRNDDGIEWNGVFDVSEMITLEASGSAYRTQFKEESQAVFFSGRWNWQSRFKQRFRLKRDWIIDLTEYYRAPRYGAQSISLSQYYINASIQKSFQQKRGHVTLSLRDVLDSRVFGTEVVGEGFNLENNYKFQTQVLTLSVRYKVLD
ncbi:TonB-dependent receptor [Ekhidna sp.]